MRQGAARALLLAALALLLGGCALGGPLREAPGSQAAAEAAFLQRMATLRRTERFELQGRIAVKGGALSGALRWSQQPDAYRLRIAGPFGAGALLLEGQGGRVRIQSKDVDVTTDEPEALLAAQTGWQLPLKALRYWLLGIPAPGTPAQLQVDAAGRAVELRQNGWTLRYPEYLPASPYTPSRVEAARDDWAAVALVQSLSLTPALP